MLPLEFQPDSRYAYSNAGINTAARMLEVVTGQAYETFMQTRLFDPLGMVDTTFWPSQAQVARLATTYRPGEGNVGLLPTTISQLRYPLTARVGRHPMPAGGLFSTAADVARFGRMILRGGELDGRRYVSEASVAAMATRQTAADIPESYGLGWGVGDGWFGHGGALATDLKVDRQRGRVLVYLVQHAGFPGEGGKGRELFERAASGG
jgi:CubicO group peptidase (beta-lactamase class C family)